MDKQRLSSLDTCRGIAILMVIGFHASITYPSFPWVNRCLQLGNLGVQLFFLVSAVTMSFMWEQRQDETDRQLKFYIRRVARIAPLFWFAIIFYTLLWGTAPSARAPEGLRPVDFVLTALFLHPFSPSAINTVVPGGWSIGIEMAFYAIFPLLAGLHPNRLLTLALAAYVLLGLLGTTIAQHFGNGEPFALFLYYSMLTQIPIFPIGMFIYSVALREDKFKMRNLVALVILWLTIAFIAKYEFGLTSRPVLWTQIVVLSLVVWGALRWRLGHGVLAYIGRLSYSMYLFHFAVLYFLERSFTYHWPYLVGFAFAFLPTLAIAIVSQRTAEKWSQDLGRYFIANMDRRCTAKALPLREH
jgi:exopolysaccharide production protein ExoZ